MNHRSNATHYFTYDRVCPNVQRCTKCAVMNENVQCMMKGCLCSDEVSGGDLAPSLGGTEKFLADQDFRMRFYRKKFPFSRRKFLMTFLVIDQVFLIFPFFSQIFRIFYYVKCRIYDPFLTRTTTILEKFLYDTFF